MKIDNIEQARKIMHEIAETKKELGVIRGFQEGGYFLNSSLGQGIHFILDTFKFEEDKQPFLDTLYKIKEEELDALVREWEAL